MNGAAERACSKRERLLRVLMVWGAVVLFALGLLLLMAPARPQDSGSAGDNGVRCERMAQCELVWL